jgi:hypothetical protein
MMNTRITWSFSWVVRIQEKSDLFTTEGVFICMAKVPGSYSGGLFILDLKPVGYIETSAAVC